MARGPPLWKKGTDPRPPWALVLVLLEAEDILPLSEEEVNELVDERWGHDVGEKLLAGCVLLAIYLTLRTIRSLSTHTVTFVLLVKGEVLKL